MKEFRKKDLRTGMIVVTKGKGNFIIIGEELRNETYINKDSACFGLQEYEENLITKDSREYEFNIIKVYEIIGCPSCESLNIQGLIKEIEDCDFGKLIWEEKNPRLRIDWTKVPKWTKVLAQIKTIFGNSELRKAYFLGYEEGMVF